LRDFIERNATIAPGAEAYSLSENQLTIFDVINEIEKDD
jgi:hypothetical protein